MKGKLTYYMKVNVAYATLTNAPLLRYIIT